MQHLESQLQALIDGFKSRHITRATAYSLETDLNHIARADVSPDKKQECLDFAKEWLHELSSFDLPNTHFAHIERDCLDCVARQLNMHVYHNHKDVADRLLVLRPGVLYL